MRTELYLLILGAALILDVVAILLCQMVQIWRDAHRQRLNTIEEYHSELRQRYIRIVPNKTLADAEKLSLIEMLKEIQHERSNQT